MFYQHINGVYQIPHTSKHIHHIRVAEPVTTHLVHMYHLFFAKVHIVLRKDHLFISPAQLKIDKDT